MTTPSAGPPGRWKTGHGHTELWWQAPNFVLIMWPDVTSRSTREFPQPLQAGHANRGPVGNTWKPISVDFIVGSQKPRLLLSGGC